MSLQTFRTGPRRSFFESPQWRNANGSAALFAMGLGMAWLMHHFLGLSWDQSLLVEILWLTAMNRWHQPDKGSSPNG